MILLNKYNFFTQSGSKMSIPGSSVTRMLRLFVSVVSPVIFSLSRRRSQRLITLLALPSASAKAERAVIARAPTASAETTSGSVK